MMLDYFYGQSGELFSYFRMGTFPMAFANPLPSLHPLDLLCRAQSSSAAAMIAFAPPMHTVSSSPPVNNR